MNLRKLIDGDDKRILKSGVVINGPRPTPLRLKQESHTIHKQHHQQIRKPIIIYTYSPEVIHAKPNDFMALVQKLTGHSSSSDDDREQPNQKKTLKQDGYDQNRDESKVPEEKDEITKAKSPMPFNRYVADIPRFTPNSGDYFSSPRPYFRFSDMVSPSSNASLSPASLVELLKGLPEY